MLYVYSGASGVLLFKLNGNTDYQEFGFRIASAGDLDADGFGDLAIASEESGPGQTGRGRVEVFSGRTRAILLSLVGQAPDESLGYGLDGRTDFDHDGSPDLLVGDMNCDRNGVSSGAAYVYSGATGKPLMQWGGNGPDALFGMDVAFLGDCNGDGQSEILIGSVIGVAYLYSGASGRLLYAFSSGRKSDDYGQFVSATNDLTGDGLSDLLITAEWDSQGLFHAGRGYLYGGNDLFLQAAPMIVRAGDIATLSIRAREPNVLAALYITDISGIATFQLLDIGFCDSSGERSISGTVPPGLTGIDLTFQAFSQDSRSGTVDSAPQYLQFK